MRSEAHLSLWRRQVQCAADRGQSAVRFVESFGSTFFTLGSHEPFAVGRRCCATLTFLGLLMGSPLSKIRTLCDHEPFYGRAALLRSLNIKAAGHHRPTGLLERFMGRKTPTCECQLRQETYTELSKRCCEKNSLQKISPSNSACVSLKSRRREPASNNRSFNRLLIGALVQN